MGVTLHYRATLPTADQLATLTDEVEDICQSMGWKYKRIDLDLDSGIAPEVIQYIAGSEAKMVSLKGIIFTVHEQSESVCLTFDEQNRLLAPYNVMAGDVYPTFDDMFWAHTKTQFAGPDTHAIICRLLRYLGDRYFAEIEVIDEANYWESEDVEELQKTFDRTGKAVSLFKEALESYPGHSPKTVEELAQKIEVLFRKIIDRNNK